MTSSCLGPDTAAFQAKHQDIFPTKAMLQLKIREVRQKIMADIKMDDPGGRPSTGNSTTASESDTTLTSSATSSGTNTSSNSQINSGMVSSLPISVQQVTSQKVNSTKVQPTHLLPVQPIRGQQLSHVTLSQAASSMSGLVAVATVTSGSSLLSQGTGVQH